MTGRLLVVANWKMHPVSLGDAEDLFLDTVDEVSSVTGVDVVVCPPVPFIAPLKELYKGKKITLGGQDVFWEKQGSYTGEYGPPQLTSAGAEYVIIGHSERRVRGETDAVVCKKVRAALSAGLTVILCIGERERDVHGEYLSVLRSQIHAALAEVPTAKVARLRIAYEPVWAIGKSAEESITTKALHETTIFIRKVLRERFAKKVAQSIPVLYGGSVEPANAKELLADCMVDGFLVGHASRKPVAFCDIVTSVAQACKQREKRS